MTTPIMVQFVIPRLTHDIFHLYTEFGDSRFNRFERMIASVEIDKTLYFINEDEQPPAAYSNCIAV